MTVTVRAPAKINLALLVGSPRPDGFHPLDTVYQAISLYDDVRVSDAERWSVSVVPVGAVDCAGVPLDDSNLAVRAGRLLAEHHGLERAAAVEVFKGIPVAGGLAGGSADAAAVLVALDRLWGANTSDADLLALAARLGSDVPFALVGGTARGTGRGEQVVPAADAGEHWWVVVPSDEGLATPAVYRRFDDLAPGAALDDPVALLDALAAGAPLGEHLRNDLQAAAIALRPTLAERLRLVASHAEAALVSGSGPTVLGLTASQDSAREARAALLEAGLPFVHVATGPVAGAHVVEWA